MASFAMSRLRWSANATTTTTSSPHPKNESSNSPSKKTWQEILADRQRVYSDPLAQGVCIMVVVAAIRYVMSERGLDKLAEATISGSSPIDWCEGNYEVNQNVAEFWNTLSSLPALIAAAKVWQVMVYGRFDQIRPSAHLIWISFFLIAIGSAYFHARLSLLGQITDEVPIVMVNVYAMVLLPSRKNIQDLLGNRAANFFQSKSFALAFLIGFPVLGFWWPLVSHVACVLTLPALTASIYRSYCRIPTIFSFNLFLFLRYKRLVRPVFMRAFYCAVFGFAMWVIDQLGCSAIKWFRLHVGFEPQFHAVWHLLIFSSAWNTGMCLFILACIEEEIPMENWGLRPIIATESIRKRFTRFFFADEWILKKPLDVV
eukprot:m.77737 g.77737  ORF g.77737 m.77737 type:complete len:372 (+) comp25043_c0_seq1:424-1539(+)